MQYATRCPHCGNEDSAPGAFCAACGKALPTAVRTPPRLVGGGQFATTVIGQLVQGDDLRRRSKKAELAILAVAVIQTIVGVLALLASNNSFSLMKAQLTFATVSAFGVAAAFWGLYAWAQRQPLPAGIIGLVLYGTRVGINVAQCLALLSHGQSGNGIFGLGVGWVDILIIGALVRAIAAGAAHRKLLLHSAKTNAGVVPAVAA